MAFDISTFTSTVHKHGGLANPSRFRIIIPDAIEDLSLLCHSTSLPAKTFEVLPYNNGFGSDYQMPSKIEWEDVDFSFYVTNNNYAEKIYFDAWMDRIVNRETNFIQYKNTFVQDITIECYNNKNFKIYQLLLEEAFPTGMSAIELTSESNTPVSITVSMSYKRWIQQKIEN